MRVKIGVIILKERVCSLLIWGFHNGVSFRCLGYEIRICVCVCVCVAQARSRPDEDAQKSEAPQTWPKSTVNPRPPSKLPP